MSLFEEVKVDKELVAKIAKENWDVELGDILKVSQNHTFLTKRGDEKLILRVTPDPDNSRVKSTELEMSVLEYLYENKLTVSPPIRSKISNKPLIVINDGGKDQLILCLFQYATGEPVVYQDWKWMVTKDIVVGLGKWFGQLHKLLRRFQVEQPELSSHARHWTELHKGILKGVEVHEDDRKSESDPNQFMIIHGDVNPSNYFWDADRGMPSMFDWDQLQRSWYLYDLSAPIWGVVTLKKAGSPIDRSAVPQANPEEYTNWLLEGYEKETSQIVDRKALERMVLIRRELYIRFCTKALEQLPADHPMASFCKFMVDFFAQEDQGK